MISVESFLDQIAFLAAGHQAVALRSLLNAGHADEQRAPVGNCFAGSADFVALAHQRDELGPQFAA